MAVTKRVTGSTRSTRLSKGRAALSLSLPTEKSQPASSIPEVTMLVYGEPGIGKTSFTSKFPGAFSLMFEPGDHGVEIFSRPCPTWKHFVGYVDLVIASDRFQVVCIDVAEKAYDRCFEHVCRVNNCSHPNDKGYGEVWKQISAEWEKHFTRLATAGKGVVFISHAKDRNFQTRSGREYQKLTSAMSPAAAEFVHGFVDVIACYTYYGDDRYLTIRGSDEVVCKNRFSNRFRAVNGRRVHSIPMFGGEDFDEEEAFRNFERAFNNEQKTSGKPKEAATLTNRAAKIKPKEDKRR